ncbi:MAG: isocitrate lyase/phosphoenolpyruvate mutase family protein [Chthoniobacterales bacterium]
MVMSQAEKAFRFRELHQRKECLLIPNPWDTGSAKILEGLGFEAIATSSAASAASLGRRDGLITREEAFVHVSGIVDATQLPVSADLENGFGDDPSVVAETIRLAVDSGLVGASIEDFTKKDRQLYSREQSVERIAAAVEVARSVDFPFMVTARCESFSHGSSDIEDTIQRLVAYEKAGADVLFAPGLPNLDAIRAVCSAVSKPVNFMVGIDGKSFSIAELVSCGVKRISFASSFYRAAMQGLFDAAREVKEQGTFDYLKNTITTPELNRFF